MLNQSQAIQLYLTNRDKFPRMSQTEAINMIRRTGGIPADTSAPPEAALATAATLPVETAAEPAPPAVEQEQPAPAQPYRGPAAAALEAFNKINPAQAAQPPAGGKVDFAELARLRGLEAKRNELKMAANLEGQATVDPELQALNDKRSNRIDAELQSMDEDRKQAVWMAIAQAGMKMAQSQSPYFMQALASGMEAGLTGYNADKAKAAEKRARLQDQKEDLAREIINARRQAGVEAVTAYNAARQGAAAEQAMEAGALKNLVMGETADEQIAEAGLRNQMIREQIASARQSRALAIEAARRARAAGGGGRGGSNVNPKNAGAFVNSLISENKMQVAILSDPLSSAAEKNQARARINENQRKIDYVRSLQSQNLGMGSEFKILGPG